MRYLLAARARLRLVRRLCLTKSEGQTRALRFIVAGKLVFCCRVCGSICACTPPSWICRIGPRLSRLAGVGFCAGGRGTAVCWPHCAGDPVACSSAEHAGLTDRGLSQRDPACSRPTSIRDRWRSTWRPCARAIFHRVLGKYHAQFNFAGRLTKPLALLDDESVHAWARQHPQGALW